MSRDAAVTRLIEIVRRARNIERAITGIDYSVDGASEAHGRLRRKLDAAHVEAYEAIEAIDDFDRVEALLRETSS